MTLAQQLRQFPPADLDSLLGHEAQGFPDGLGKIVEANHDLADQQSFGRAAVYRGMLDVQVKPHQRFSYRLDVSDAGDDAVLHGERFDQRYSRTPHRAPRPHVGGIAAGLSYGEKVPSHTQFDAIGLAQSCGSPTHLTKSRKYFSRTGKIAS